MTHNKAHISVHSLVWFCCLCSLGLLSGCSELPPPNDAQAMKLVSQYLKDSGGELEEHEALGRVRIYRPVRLYSVQTEKCYVIARDAYWCQFTVEYSTAQKSKLSSSIAFRVEIHSKKYVGVIF